MFVLSSDSWQGCARLRHRRRSRGCLARLAESRGTTLAGRLSSLDGYLYTTRNRRVSGGQAAARGSGRPPVKSLLAPDTYVALAEDLVAVAVAWGSFRDSSSLT